MTFVFEPLPSVRDTIVYVRLPLPVGVDDVLDQAIDATVVTNVCGDLDDDQIVSVLDSIIGARAASGDIQLNEIQEVLGDLDGNGIVNRADVDSSLGDIVGETPIDDCGPQPAIS